MTSKNHAPLNLEDNLIEAIEKEWLRPLGIRDNVLSDIWHTLSLRIASKVKDSVLEAVYEA